MDLNDDGKIDLDEFKAMMLKINEIAPTMTKNLSVPILIHPNIDLS